MSHNYTQLQTEIGKTPAGRRRIWLELKAATLKRKVDTAVDLGLKRRIAERKGPRWLDTFIQTRQIEQGRQDSERGHGNMENAATIRRNFENDVK